MRFVALMILEEFLVVGFAAPEAFFRSVPEAYLILAQLPAQAHSAVALPGHEVQQPDIKVLDHRAGLMNLVQSVFEGGNTGVAPGPRRQDFAGVDPRAAGRPHVVGGAVHVLLSLLRFVLVK